MRVVSKRWVKKLTDAPVASVVRDFRLVRVGESGAPREEGERTRKSKGKIKAKETEYYDNIAQARWWHRHLPLVQSQDVDCQDVTAI
jgi:hypothetical protein